MIRTNKRYTLPILLVICLVILITCSKKIVNNDELNSLEFQIGVSYANAKLAQLITTYQVTIIADNDTIVAQLELVEGEIVGTVENVPAGTGRTVIVEGLDAAGVVIYRGVAVIEVIADQIVDVEITLLPVVKLVRPSPKYTREDFGTGFTSIIEAYNIDSLTQIDLTLISNSATVQLDSLIRGAGLPGGASFSYSIDTSSNIHISISHSAPLVDPNGNASLATAYFRGARSIQCLDSTELELSVEQIQAPGITSASIHTDDSRVVISRGRLLVSDDSLAFGLGIAGLDLLPKQLDFTDSCGNNISYTLSTDAGWIVLESAVGGITPGSNSISVDTTALPSGTYLDSILVLSTKAANAPLYVKVSLEIDHGVRMLAVLPDTLRFEAIRLGTLPASQVFEVFETSGFNIGIQVTENIAWLNLSGGNGTTEDTITVDIITTDLAAGVYEDSISITSAEATNSPVVVHVSYQITGLPNPPVLAPIGTQSVDENVNLNFGVSATDADGTTPTLRTSTLATGATFVDNLNGTGTFDWTPTFAQSGVYNVTFYATDGTATDSEIVAITVNDVNQPPVLAPIGAKSVAENLNLNFGVSATDGDGTTPTLSTSTLDTGATFVDNLDGTGTFDWTPTFAQSGTYDVTFYASDGTATDSETVTITVNEFNQSPVLAPIGTRSVDENVNLNFGVSATDADGTTPTLRTSTLATGATFVDNHNGTGTFDWTPTFAQSGVYDVTFYATDGVATDSEIVPITVNDVILPPVTPILISPDSGDINAPVSASFWWHSSTGADSYTLQLDTTPAFLAPVNIFPDIIDTVLLLEPLWYEQIYYWQVSATNVGGNSDWSNIWHFTTETFCDEIFFPDPDLRGAILMALERPFDDPAAICRHEVETITFLDIVGSSITDLTGIEALINLTHLNIVLTTSLSDIGPLSALTSLHILNLFSNNISDISPLVLNSGLTAPDTVDLSGNPLDSTSMFTHIPTLMTRGVTVITTNLLPDTNAIGIEFIAYENAPVSPESLLYHIDVAGNANAIPYTVDSVPFWMTFDSSSSVTPADILLTADATEMSQGTYVDTLFIGANLDPNPPTMIPVQLTVLPAPPTIGGVVTDSSGFGHAGALVRVFDLYPNGNVLDSAFTDEGGNFSFFGITGVFTLHAFKSSFYPVLLDVETTVDSVEIILTPLAQFTPTDKWNDLYCDSAFLFGELLQPNDVVEAYDPTDVLCGRYIVIVPGTYGFMPVYGDDSLSAEDEGCLQNEAITIKVNGMVAVTDSDLVYTEPHKSMLACFDVTGAVPKWIAILEPTGAETFYQDSTVTLKWASTGISGPLVLSISNPIVYPGITLDTIDNDGEHTFIIPTGIEQRSDWYFSLNDLDELVTASSHFFTISAVELQPQPAMLKFQAVEQKCTPAQRSFSVSESHNFAIQYQCTENIPWVTLVNPDGTTSGIVTIDIDISGLSLGTFVDSIMIESAQAVNSPQFLYVELDVGEYLCGDIINDCELRAGDVTHLIDFMYRNGPPLEFPGAASVDGCEGIDIADVDLWYNSYLRDNALTCESATGCSNPVNDQGAPDTLTLAVAVYPDLVSETYLMQLDLYLFNDANVVNGLSAGFAWDNTNLRLDSTVFEPFIKDSMTLVQAAFEDGSIDSTNVNQRFLFAANRSLFSGIHPSSSQKLLASYYFNLSSWAATDSIVIDTLTFSEGTTYKSTTDQGSYTPYWAGPVIIRNPGT